MNWKIDKTPIHNKQPEYKVGDLAFYRPTGNVYLLVKEHPRKDQPSLFDYVLFSGTGGKMITGKGGSFAASDFSLFQGSITLSN